MSLFNQITKTRFYLRRSDSQRIDNDFHIIHVCDSASPQFGTAGRSVRNAPPSPALDSGVRLANELHAAPALAP
jgi:hypothetical protein